MTKSSPNLVQRFQAFCTAEKSKRLKESADTQSMDLHSYVEFKRNYRAATKTHKETLSQLREVWKLMLKPEPRADRIDTALASLDASVERSHRVYKRVIERYPKNGKLLKCYGRFLEDIKNDFKHAGRAYGEATKQGGSGNGLLSMDFDFASQPGKPEMLLSLDINEDAVAVINAEGSLMLVSQVRSLCLYDLLYRSYLYDPDAMMLFFRLRGSRLCLATLKQSSRGRMCRCSCLLPFPNATPATSRDTRTGGRHASSTLSRRWWPFTRTRASSPSRSVSHRQPALPSFHLPPRPLIP